MNRDLSYIKKGFYLINDEVTTRCFYLSGDTRSNYWIETEAYVGTTKSPNPNPRWMNLVWTCIPLKKELSQYTYFEENPLTNFPLIKFKG